MAAAAYRSAVRTLTAPRSSPNLSNIIASSYKTKTLNPKSIPAASPFLSSSTPSRSTPLRFALVLASLESMMPLHSAIASARLKSKIAVDSACWSWLSQGFATPL